MPSSSSNALISIVGVFTSVVVGFCLSIGTGNAASAPVLAQISPSEVRAGVAYPVQATITGTGFAPSGNTVQFGPVRIPDLSSADGTHLTFSVPKDIIGRSEVPPLVLQPGDYSVTVTTSAGTSNSLNFRMIR